MSIAKKKRSKKRYDIETAILSNEAVADAHYLLRCECAEIARRALPGQFVHVLISDVPGRILRRPFTIYSAQGSEITMLYQVIGAGTKRLSEMPKGARVRVLGPLGNPFDVTNRQEPALLVGGGAGIASLMLLATALRADGIQTLALVGAQHQGRLLSVADLETINITAHISTDDGSAGHHGVVTDVLERLLSKHVACHLEKTAGQRPAIYACGPNRMLAAVAKIAADFQIPTQVAMENRMGCALGVCLGCVCPVRRDDNHFEYQRVCTEGPVFHATDIVWNLSESA